MSHNPKQPTKGELAGSLVEAQRHIQQLYRIINEVNTRLVAVCQAKVTPDVLAKFILDEPGQEAYMKNMNLAIDAEIEKKKEARKPKVSDETKAAVESAKL